MRWALNGGQGVLTVRSLIQSDLFDKGWALLFSQYKQEVALPKNVIEFRKK
jgi:hypothetical protein